jgi:hypothetical protein
MNETEIPLITDRLPRVVNKCTWIVSRLGTVNYELMDLNKPIETMNSEGWELVTVLQSITGVMCNDVLCTMFWKKTVWE